MRPRNDEHGRAFWIVTGFVVGLFVIALGMDSQDDPGSYLVPCPRGVDHNTMCFP
jgi:hypothetical protein